MGIVRIHDYSDSRCSRHSFLQEFETLLRQIPSHVRHAVTLPPAPDDQGLGRVENADDGPAYAHLSKRHRHSAIERLVMRSAIPTTEVAARAEWHRD